MPHGRGQVQQARLGGTRDGRITAYQLDVRAGRRRLPAHRRGPADDDPAHDHAASTTSTTSASPASRWSPTPCRPPPTAAPAGPRRRSPSSAWSTGSPPRSGWTRPRCAGATSCPGSPSRTPPASAPSTTWATTPSRSSGPWRRPATTSCAPSRRAVGPRATRSRSASASPRTSRSPRACRTRSSPRSRSATTARLRVVSGATPYGQGHDTTWAMIVADRTGVPIERIEVVHGDTDLVRSGGLTVGSRSVQLAGAAVAAATTELVDAARERAADLFEAARGRRRARPRQRPLPRRRHAGRAASAGPTSSTPSAAPTGPVGRGALLRAADADVPVRRPTSPSSRSTPRPDTCGCAGTSPSTTPAR